MANGKITSVSAYGPSPDQDAPRSAPVAYPALGKPGKAPPKILKRMARRKQKLAAKEEEKKKAFERLLKGGRILEPVDK